MSTLRAVLAAVRAARPGTGLDDVARSLGLSRDEVDAMVDFWVRRGELTAEPLRGCPSAGRCGARDGARGGARDGVSGGVPGGGGCPSAGAGCPLAALSGRAGGDGRPALVVIGAPPGDR